MDEAASAARRCGPAANPSPLRAGTSPQTSKSERFRLVAVEPRRKQKTRGRSSRASAKCVEAAYWRRQATRQRKAKDVAVAKLREERRYEMARMQFRLEHFIKEKVDTAVEERAAAIAAKTPSLPVDAAACVRVKLVYAQCTDDAARGVRSSDDVCVRLMDGPAKTSRQRRRRRGSSRLRAKWLHLLGRVNFVPRYRTRLSLAITSMRLELRDYRRDGVLGSRRPWRRLAQRLLWVVWWRQYIRKRVLSLSRVCPPRPSSLLCTPIIMPPDTNWWHAHRWKERRQRPRKYTRRLARRVPRSCWRRVLWSLRLHLRSKRLVQQAWHLYEALLAVPLPSRCAARAMSQWCAALDAVDLMKPAPDTLMWATRWDGSAHLVEYRDPWC